MAPGQLQATQIQILYIRRASVQDHVEGHRWRSHSDGTEVTEMTRPGMACQSHNHPKGPHRSLTHLESVFWLVMLSPIARQHS